MTDSTLQVVNERCDSSVRANHLLSGIRHLRRLKTMNPDKTYEAIEAVTQELESVESYFDASSFFGSFVRDMAESVAGNLSNQKVLMTDVFHASNCRKIDQFAFTLRETHMQVGEVEDISEYWSEAERKIHENLVDTAEFMGDADEDFLAEIADYIIDAYLIQESFFGAKAEQIVAETLCEAEEWTYVAESGIIGAELNVEHPEAKGIDLWFPEPDLTAQVKRGTGGDLSDECEADIALRLIAPDEDNELVFPEVRWYDLRD